MEKIELINVNRPVAKTPGQSAGLADIDLISRFDPHQHHLCAYPDQTGIKMKICNCNKKKLHKEC